jgi:hypothetical protein
VANGNDEDENGKVRSVFTVAIRFALASPLLTHLTRKVDSLHCLKLLSCRNFCRFYKSSMEKDKETKKFKLLYCSVLSSGLGEYGGNVERAYWIKGLTNSRHTIVLRLMNDLSGAFVSLR